MPRLTIQQFRAALSDRSSPSAVVRAYRELTRRPGLAAGMVRGEWSLWTQVDAPAAA
jgi:hypothetical protein